MSKRVFELIMNIYKVGFMSEWKTNKLSEVAKVVTGKTPSTSNSAYFGGNIPFVSPADLNEGVLQETKTYLTELGAEQVYLVPKDTVLVSCIGNLGKLAITNQEVCFNQQINGLIFDQTKIYPKYGFYAAQTFKPQLEKASSSTTLPIVNKSKFSEILISYPPLSEQKRIAEILDKADELRQKRQQSIEKLDELLQATFVDMFGDPVSNPKGWETKPLKNLALKVQSGNTPKGGKENYLKEGITFFRSQNVWKNKIIYDDIAFIDEETHKKMLGSSLKHKDILMTKTGRINTENSSLGRAAIYLGEDDKANLNGHVYLIRLSEKVNPFFILSI